MFQPAHKFGRVIRTNQNWHEFDSGRFKPRRAIQGSMLFWNAMDWQALTLTLRLASIPPAILLLIAIPLGALLVLGRSRWLAVLQALTTLPLVLPPTVLGFFLLVLLGPRTAL